MCMIVEPFLWMDLEYKRLNEGRAVRKKIKKYALNIAFYIEFHEK